MSSMFTWVDFADDDRRKMADVIALFNEKDTRETQDILSLRATTSRLWPAQAAGELILPRGSPCYPA